MDIVTTYYFILKTFNIYLIELFSLYLVNREKLNKIALFYTSVRGMVMLNVVSL